MSDRERGGGGGQTIKIGVQFTRACGEGVAVITLFKKGDTGWDEVHVMTCDHNQLIVGECKGEHDDINNVGPEGRDTTTTTTTTTTKQNNGGAFVYKAIRELTGLLDVSAERVETARVGEG